MKKNINALMAILGIAVLGFGLSSCQKFLTEHPKTFLSPGEFYTSEDQIAAAVNGTYKGIARPWTSDFLGLGIGPMLSMEDYTGYCYRTFLLGAAEANFLNPQDPIPSDAGYLSEFWSSSVYYPLENCNSVIENVSKSEVISEDAKNKYLGQVYFLRAYYYFLGVRLFGAMPLKITPTTSLTNLELPKASVEEIYDQIVSDLTLAEQSGLPWTDKSGRVNMGAIKTLLSKVYLTMAGYPLQKGNEYYQKAYDKAKEVIGNGSYFLFPNYDDLRDPANDNAGEHILMLQMDASIKSNMYSTCTLPNGYPVAAVNEIGGVMTPEQAFYDSYAPGDKRRTGYFYTEKPNYKDPGEIVKLPQPFLLKYFDDAGALTGLYGNNIPILKYSDVLLVCAEAKAGLDGGTTTDAAAIDAYYAVRGRAMPGEAKPTSITTDQVLKERFWELCYEFKNWFDMVRTHKAFDVINNKMVDFVGYQAPSHIRPFKESDLLLPIPLKEIDLNPLLK